MKNLKICFCVPNAYSLFDTHTNYYFGGAELRSSIFAKGLAEFSDMDVHFITNNYNQYPFNKIQKVKLFPDLFYRSEKKSYKSISTLFNNIFLFYVKVLARIKGAGQYDQYLKEYWLNKINADCYFLFSTTKQSMEVVDFCSKKNKAYFHFIAHDSQVMPANSEKINKIIKTAAKIFTQNTFQYQSVKKLRENNIYLINNPVQPIQTIDTKEKKSKTILWVGKANEIKNPLLFIELCKLNPDKKFVMVCVNDFDELFKSIRNSLPSNVEFYEFLPLQKMNKVFSESYLFVSTAGYEGFPNTFLQAAIYSLPVISVNVNPNNYITDFNCGRVVENSIKDLNEELNLIFNDTNLYNELAANHYKYVLKYHNRESIIKQLYDHLIELKKQ